MTNMDDFRARVERLFALDADVKFGVITDLGQDRYEGDYGLDATIKIGLVEDCVRDGYALGLAAPKHRPEIAYTLAGLSALTAVRGLTDGQLLPRILELCGELELSSRHRSADASWRRLGRFVSLLPPGHDRLSAR